MRQREGGIALLEYAAVLVVFAPILFMSLGSLDLYLTRFNMDETFQRLTAEVPENFLKITLSSTASPTFSISNELIQNSLDRLAQKSCASFLSSNSSLKDSQIRVEAEYRVLTIDTKKGTITSVQNNGFVAEAGKFSPSTGTSAGTLIQESLTTSPQSTLYAIPSSLYQVSDKASQQYLPLGVVVGIRVVMDLSHSPAANLSSVMGDGKNFIVERTAVFPLRGAIHS